MTEAQEATTPPTHDHDPAGAAESAVTRAAYDAVAADYAAHFVDDLGEGPVARAMIAAFAELVRKSGGGPVADLGCGPGRVTTLLDALGLDAYGLDLSPGMVAEARKRYPELRFEVGSMLALDREDGSLAGILAWYSIIHTAPERLPALFAEFHRVLAPGGQLLLAFQVGEEIFHLPEAFGHRIDLDYHRWTVPRIEALLRDAGLAPDAHLFREAYENERTPQAYVLAHKPHAGG